jgi:hypothetical protein
MEKPGNSFLVRTPSGMQRRGRAWHGTGGALAKRRADFSQAPSKVGGVRHLSDLSSAGSTDRFWSTGKRRLYL